MTKKPFMFTATKKPFVVQIDQPCAISGYTEGDRFASYYNPIPVKKGDTFSVAKGGVRLNGSVVARLARPLKKMAWRISWVSKRLRVAVFQEKDRLFNRRTKKFSKRFGKAYWVACDLRSYHIGCGDDVVQAVNRLIQQCQATNDIAQEEKDKGNGVIRWRCLLDSKEIKEMETKARKTGFILDGVELSG